MDTINTRTKFVAAVAAIAGAAVLSPLIIDAGTAQAIPDIGETTPLDCPSCFNPQPDPPGYPDPRHQVGIGNPNILPPLNLGPGFRVGIGDPTDGVSAPFFRSPFGRFGITDPTEGGASPPYGRVGIGDPSDGVSAPENRTQPGA
jgi:hypothetical protein